MRCRSGLASVLPFLHLLVPPFVTAGAQSLAAHEHPPRVSRPGLVYDAARRVTVFFGGADAVRRHGDTWEWNGAQWRRRDLPGPEPRFSHGMAYDSRRRVVVLFGGFGSATPLLGDTWEYDGRSWTRRATGGPAPRGTPALAYDSVRGRTVLYGGSQDAGRPSFRDTWEWDGRTWTRVDTAGPPGTVFHAMAYDARRARVVAFGGRGGGGLTWEWDGRTWTKRADGGLPPRDHHAMTWDARRGRVLAIGGVRQNADGSNPADPAVLWLRDTWAWDGERWAQLDEEGAPWAGGQPGFVHDAARDRLVLVGDGELAGTWERDDRGWSRRTAPVAAEQLAFGPHPVGYRLIVHHDWTRAAGHARGFDGSATGASPSLPLAVSVWYPARTRGTPLTFAEYAGIGRTGTSVPAATDSLRAAVMQPLRTTARFRYGRELTDAESATIASLPYRASLDAAPAAGRFPIILGGLEGPSSAAPWAEYLASHGYVVVTTPSTGRTATLQVTAPAVAIESQTRNLETMYAVARALPFADAARVGVIGLNFDGYAALAFQSRTGRARAIVTLDGWEGKAAGDPTLSAFPGFDPKLVRVPYLGFMQADPPSPALQANPAILARLKYAPRALYVLPGLRHDHYVGGSATFPILTDTARRSYRAVFDGVRTLFDAYVRDTTPRAARPGAPPYAPTLPNGTRTVFADARPALPAVPDAAEFEALVMAGNMARVQEVVRAAVRADSTVRLFEPPTMTLFAFRYRQRGDSAAALALLSLATEALPRDALAWSNLGNEHAGARRMDEARTAWRRALDVLDADPTLATEAKTGLRRQLEQRLSP